jgi:hypothetical protein
MSQTGGGHGVPPRNASSNGFIEHPKSFPSIPFMSAVPQYRAEAEPERFPSCPIPT